MRLKYMCLMADMPCSESVVPLALTWSRPTWPRPWPTPVKGSESPLDDTYSVVLYVTSD